MPELDYPCSPNQQGMDIVGGMGDKAGASSQGGQFPFPGGDVQRFVTGIGQTIYYLSIPGDKNIFVIARIPGEVQEEVFGIVGKAFTMS